MSIDKEKIKHISKLARISLDPKKSDSLAKDLTSIFKFIEQLNEIQVIPDIVLCCCGGGGLIAGISTAIKEKFKNTKIYLFIKMFYGISGNIQAPAQEKKNMMLQ